MVVRDWPIECQPEEQLLSEGPDQLSDVDLLALIVGNGHRHNAIELARDLLVRTGGLHELSRGVPSEMLTQEKAVRVAAAFELGRRVSGPSVEQVNFNDSATVAHYYIPRMCGMTTERFIVVLLNARNRLIRDVTVSEGNLTASIVHPREVFHPAIVHHAASVIFVHNHPSGDPTPSQDDIKVTTQLVESGKILDIRVLDHVIVGSRGFTSMAAKSLL